MKQHKGFTYETLINRILFIVHTAVCVYFAILSFQVVRTVKPLPTSDFIYYWNLASDLSIYHKGGIIGFIYAPFKAFGIAPYWSAFIVNSFFLGLVYLSTWLTFKKFRHPVGIMGQLLMTAGLAMFGLWNAAYSGLVNADFPNVALLIVATRGFSLFGANKKKGWLIFAGFMLFFAVALRVKTGLALGIIVFIIGLFHFGTIKKERVAQWVILVICLSVGFSAVSEILLRSQSDSKLDVARQGRLQLYTGLLYTETGSMCGRWTKAAFEKTLEEIDVPLLEVIERHLSVKSKRYILEIIGCKIDHVLKYDEFAYRELLAFGVKHRAYTDADLEIVRAYEKIEETWVNRFKNLVYVMVALTLLLWRRLKIPFAIAPFAIYFSFLLLHSIFEIQARYMVEPLLWSYYAAVCLIFEVSINRVKKTHDTVQ